MSIVGSNQNGDYVYADITNITSYPLSYAGWVKVGTGYVQFDTIIALHNTTVGETDGKLDLFLNDATTAGYELVTLSRNSPSSGQHNQSQDDAIQHDVWQHFAVVANAADNVEVYFNGSLAFTATVARDVVASGLSRLILLSKGSANMADAKIAEVGAWDGVALSSSAVVSLQTKTPDNIGVTPSYYWDLKNDINANIGGINLVDGGTSSYTQDAADHPSLTGPSASPTKLLGTTTKLLGGSGSLFGV